MKKDTIMAALDNFTNRAAAYAKGRPGYPNAAIEKIIALAPSEAVFADIGAGTGKFTQELAKYGRTVYAVEPNADMRSQLAATLAPYPNAMMIPGTAETTTLPDHSVDIITVAHALHWFDLETFRAECRRILKPNGLIVVIYNHVPGEEMRDFCRQAVDAFFTNPTIWSFDNPIRYTRENWLAYIASQDDNPLPGHPEYEEHFKKLNEIFNRDSVDGLLHCDRLTKVYFQKENFL